MEENKERLEKDEACKRLKRLFSILAMLLAVTKNGISELERKGVVIITLKRKLLKRNPQMPQKTETTYSQDYVICPHCNEKSGQQVSHLYDQTPRQFGQWACGKCDRYFSGTVNAPGAVTLVKEDRPPKTRLLTLLKSPGKNGDVFFIQNHFDYGHGDPGDDLQSHNQYFFEEHSCPTNWLRDTAVVVQNGNQDPHGFLEHIRTIRVARDFDERNYELVEKTFPEIKHAEAV